MTLRWIFPMILVAAPRAFAQVPPPELHFTDPPGFYRGASYPPAEFHSQEVNASLQIYPFRAIAGDIRQAFSQTLLRDLIDVRFREVGSVMGVQLVQGPMPGADFVMRARFQEAGLGVPRERFRLVVVSGTAVAIVDAAAVSLASWQRVEPQIVTLLTSLRIAAGPSPPTTTAMPPSAARAVAGVYMGYTTRYNAVYRQQMPAWFYYLLSADGRVYRTYDDPGNDPARFDFVAAQRADPVNSGQYTIRGTALAISLGPPNQPEAFEVAFPAGGAIVIKGIRYERQ